MTGVGGARTMHQRAAVTLWTCVGVLLSALVCGRSIVRQPIPHNPIEITKTRSQLISVGSSH